MVVVCVGGGGLSRISGRLVCAALDTSEKSKLPRALSGGGAVKKARPLPADVTTVRTAIEDN